MWHNVEQYGANPNPTSSEQYIENKKICATSDVLSFLCFRKTHHDQDEQQQQQTTAFLKAIIKIWTSL